MTRPMLLPGVPLLWRSARTVQFGLSPHRAVVVELANPTTVALLELLDGSASERSVLAAADRRGIDQIDARALLQVLAGQGLVVPDSALVPRGFDEPTRRRLTAEAAALALRRRPGPAPSNPAAVLRKRANARVRLTGPGRLGVPIALALAAAGVGHVDPALDGCVEPGECLFLGIAGRLGAEEVPSARRELATGAIARLAPGTRTAALKRREDATFVVHLGPAHAPTALHALAHRRLPHLAVGVREGAVLVGPLVPPAGSPCAGCIDLHRTDRDPRWPAMAAQLAARATPRAGEVSEACAATTALAATAFATAEVLRYLDGEPPQTVGATVEILAAGETRRRTWSAHPDCHCVRREGGLGNRR